MSTDSNKPEAIIYCRTARAAPPGTGQEIRAQEERCRTFAASKGYSVKAAFSDEGVSGNAAERPGIQALLAYLSGHKRDGACVVLLDDVSRLARDLALHLLLRREIAEAGGKLECPSVTSCDDAGSRIAEGTAGAEVIQR